MLERAKELASDGEDIYCNEPLLFCLGVNFQNPIFLPDDGNPEPPIPLQYFARCS
jgi:hypothetical protein